MAVRSFDRKFGAKFLESLPGSPGVYLVYDQQDELIYVGKAINLKRRLSQYRNIMRRKKHPACAGS
jgi:excinuclease ABC subunit C